MSDITLNSNPNLVVKACFLEKGSGLPLDSQNFKVRLYDKDIVDDDFLGESVPDEQGVVSFSFSHEAFTGENISFDAYPDLYFQILKHDEPVFRTKVLENLYTADISQFKMGSGEILDMGTFLIQVPA